MTELGRRDFFSLLATAGISAMLADHSQVSRRVAGARLTVTAVGDDEVASSLMSGVRMGLVEAQRSAAMFGGQVTLRAVDEPGLITHVEGGAQVVIDARRSTREPQRTLEKAAESGAVFMNVRKSDDLRAACFRHVLHVAPTTQSIMAAGASPGDGVVAWHPSLTRFGADTLNKRYRAQHGSPMDADAWTGWFAFKCAWEATLAAKPIDSLQLITHMERDTTRFDGHKGSPLYFNRRHELAQPLYIVRGGSVIGEVPPAERSATESACVWK